MKGLKKVVVLGMIILFQQAVNAQTKSELVFLEQLGVADSLYSKTLKESRKFYVQLPASYDPKNKIKYPVVFIIDGDVLLPTVNNVQGFYNGGFTPEMVLIGISNAENRTRDLTTSVVTERRGMPFTAENGKAANFSEFIEQELIPFVENKYPVTNFRTLIGHSYGGLFAIYSLLNHPDLFTNYIAIDPSLDWDDQKLLKQAQEQFAGRDYKGKSLFVSLSGQLHMQDPTITIDNVMADTSDYTLFSRSNIMFSKLAEQTAENGLAFSWKFYPRDLHGTIPFPSIMEGLIFDFEWYQMEHTDKFNSPETSKEELFEVVSYRAKKLERYFNYPVPPYPEDLFNALGYMSLDMEQLEKSKMFFELGIQYYPKSANSYDAMADYYERTKDSKKALEFATMAYELNGDSYYKERIATLKEKLKG